MQTRLRIISARVALVALMLAALAPLATSAGAHRQAAHATPPATPAASTAVTKDASTAVPPVVSGPRSNDAWIDAQIADITAYGNRYRGAFVDEVVRYHAGPRELVAELLASRGWQPGDVYYACALAQTAGRPCRAAVTLREQMPDAGWAAIAEALGLADDREALPRLKRDITASYAHWARPLAKPMPPVEIGSGKTVRPAARRKRR